MNVIKKLLVFFLTVITSSVIAQRIPDYGVYKVRIAQSDKTIQADIAPVSSSPEAETDKLYYWYSSNAIHTTQGGYSGKLLNGRYTEYYLNKNLKEQGTFFRGLKDGVWTNWGENGVIIQTYTWKKGIKAGDFRVFDSKGKAIQSGSYRNNLLDGKVKTFDDSGKIGITDYKSGVVVIDSASQFWQKINVLKKIKLAKKPQLKVEKKN
jgi:antitoxin component YwqK of YwqJK toxin-antitoxin module